MQKPFGAFELYICARIVYKIFLKKYYNSKILQAKMNGAIMNIR